MAQRHGPVYRLRLTDEPPLSEREREVLTCYSHGLTRPMVADVLGIAPDTVKGHMQRARAKLGAKNRTQAVALAIRQGLIP